MALLCYEHVGNGQRFPRLWGITSWDQAEGEGDCRSAGDTELLGWKLFNRALFLSPLLSVHI